MARELTTVIEFTGTHLKLVQAKEAAEGKVLTQVIFKELVFDSKDSAARALREALKEIKERPRTATCVLPRNEVTLRMLRLPSQEISEIGEMIKLQMAQFTPYAGEEVISDYMVAGIDEQGFTQVALVIVHKEVVERYSEIFKQAKIGLNRLVLSSQGVCNLYLYYQNKLGPSFEKETVAILDIDKSNTEICFYYKGNMVFSRALQFGGKDIREGLANELIEELRLSVGSYEKEGIGVPVKKIALANVAGNLESFSRKIESELSIPTEVINPQVELLKENNVVIPPAWTTGEVSANALLGWILQKPEKALNLLPGRLLAEHQENARSRESLTLAILFSAILALMFLSLLVKVYKKNQYLKSVTRLIEQTGRQAAEAQSQLKRFELVKERLFKSVSAADVIYELYDALPSGTALRSIDLDGDGNLSLQGTAADMAEVLNLQGNLERSAYFNNVEVKYASKRNAPPGEVTDFKIVCRAGTKKK
jgi:Tfp pilus assembly PilM family ATPase/Tfp pilus assembly protein PilN